MVEGVVDEVTGEAGREAARAAGEKKVPHDFDYTRAGWDRGGYARQDEGQLSPPAAPLKRLVAPLGAASRSSQQNLEFKDGHLVPQKPFLIVPFGSEGAGETEL